MSTYQNTPFVCPATKQQSKNRQNPKKGIREIIAIILSIVSPVSPAASCREIEFAI
jgi:hypothetical protein